MNFDRLRFTLRGAFFVWINRPKQAIAAYVEAFRADPGNAETARTLAWLHARDKHWGAAQEWFRRSLEIEPEHADTWFNYGYALEQNGQFDPAIDSFRKAVELKPSQDRAWYGLGMARAAQGRHGEAATALEEAARLQPMAGEVWYQLGMAQHHALNPDRVKGVVEHLRGFDPRRSNQLIRDTERGDLRHLVQDLPF